MEWNLNTMEEKIEKIIEICIDFAKEGPHEGYWCGASNAMDALWWIMEILGALDEWPEDDEK